LGLVAATATFEFLANLAPGAMAGFKTLAVDWRVLAFTLSIALATTVAFGLVPLVQVRRIDVSHSLKQSGRSLAAASSSRRLRAVLISTEVALAFVLLAGAGLLLRTFANMRGTKLGCRTENVLTLSMPPSRRTGEPGKAWPTKGMCCRRSAPSREWPRPASPTTSR